MNDRRGYVRRDQRFPCGHCIWTIATRIACQNPVFLKARWKGIENQSREMLPSSWSCNFRYGHPVPGKYPGGLCPPGRRRFVVQTLCLVCTDTDWIDLDETHFFWFLLLYCSSSAPFFIPGIINVKLLPHFYYLQTLSVVIFSLLLVSAQSMACYTKNGREAGQNYQSWSSWAQHNATLKIP